MVCCVLLSLPTRVLLLRYSKFVVVFPFSFLWGVGEGEEEEGFVVVTSVLFSRFFPDIFGNGGRTFSLPFFFGVRGGGDGGQRQGEDA